MANSLNLLELSTYYVFLTYTLTHWKSFWGKYLVQSANTVPKERMLEGLSNKLLG